jgi:hypothetical protein
MQDEVECREGREISPMTLRAERVPKWKGRLANWERANTSSWERSDDGGDVVFHMLPPGSWLVRAAARVGDGASAGGRWLGCVEAPTRVADGASTRRLRSSRDAGWRWSFYTTAKLRVVQQREMPFGHAEQAKSCTCIGSVGHEEGHYNCPSPVELEPGRCNTCFGDLAARRSQKSRPSADLAARAQLNHHHRRRRRAKN